MKSWSKSLVILSLFLSSLECSGQFNSVVPKESPIPIKITIDTTEATEKPKSKGDESVTFKSLEANEAEDLKKIPALVALNNLDRAEALIASKLGAHLPVDNILVRSSFGYRVHPITKRYAFHTGIDISARLANIYAVLHGSVSSCGYNSKFGNFIVLNHGNYTTVYGHLSAVYIKTGELVEPGEIIGISGATGQATGEHLHFTVRYKGNLIEPLAFLATIMTANPNDLYLSLFN